MEDKKRRRGAPKKYTTLRHELHIKVTEEQYQFLCCQDQGFQNYIEALIAQAMAQQKPSGQL